jgi:multimeric flavodoxin WrbA
MPGQWKVNIERTLLNLQVFLYDMQAFWDATGSLWMSGALAGKIAGIFVSTASPGGGQESTAMNTLSTIAHHGIVFVPLGYKYAFAQLTNLSEVHGGTFINLPYLPYRNLINRI